MSDTIGDYYQRCREQYHEALDKLRAAQCPGCHGRGGHRNPTTDEYKVCRTCAGSGAAPGFTHEDVRRLRDEADRLADTGD